MKTSKAAGSIDSWLNHSKALYNSPRFWVWPFVALYVASLPYAIVVFDLLKDTFTLPVVKAVPAVMLMVAALVYLLTCYRRKQGYRFKTFVLPSVIVIGGVVALESNPIKYLHVPEYMLLTCLIYLGLSRQGAKVQTIVIAALLASLLGVVDEVHQGMHPERYFGWKDMLINAAGSIIGALFLNAISLSDSSIRWPHRGLLHQFRLQSFLLLTSCVIGVYAVCSLFQVADSRAFVAVYPISLFTLNLVVVGFSLVTVLKSGRLLADNHEYETLLFWPITVLMFLHGVTAYAYASGRHFL